VGELLLRLLNLSNNITKLDIVLYKNKKKKKRKNATTTNITTTTTTNEQHWT